MSDVAYQEGTWQDPATRAQFSYRSWRPSSARAVLVLLHGFGEHSGRYQAFGSSLAGRGIWVGAPDLPGHGRSSGQRGDIEQAAGCVQQLWKMTHDVFLPASGLTDYTLFGHSFGGLLAIVWAMQNPPNLRRVIVQSPLLEVGFPIPGWKIVSARLLDRLWPTASFSTNLEVEALSRDPAVVQAYRSDPLVHHVMSARVYCAILRARARAFDGTAAIRRPVLLLTGSADRIVSVEAAHRWFNRLSCEKQRVAFPDAYHELHHEPVSEDVMRLVCEWVLAGRERT